MYDTCRECGTVWKELERGGGGGEIAGVSSIGKWLFGIYYRRQNLKLL
jgi:hypothetical protein